jgi:hypothetical protein
MLSPGQELGIKDKQVLCGRCTWEGLGAELGTGLSRLEGSAVVYRYIYRCPLCGSFDVRRKGKLLDFPLAGTKTA